MKKKTITRAMEGPWSPSSSEMDSEFAETPSTIYGMKVFSPNEESILSNSSSGLIYHPTKARYEAARREAAASAADALGHDLEAMGYNLDCETFITKGSSASDMKDERYNPPNTLEAPSSLDDDSRISDIISNLRSHSDLIMNMRSDASVDPIIETRSSSPTKRSKASASSRNSRVPPNVSTSSSAYLDSSHAKYSIKSHSVSPKRVPPRHYDDLSSSDGCKDSESELLDQWRQAKVEKLLSRIDKPSKRKKKNSRREQAPVVETVSSEASSNDESEELLPYLSNDSSVSGPPSPGLSEKSSLSGPTGILERNGSSVSPSKRSGKSGFIQSKETSSNPLQKVASALSRVSSKVSGPLLQRNDSSASPSKTSRMSVNSVSKDSLSTRQLKEATAFSITSSKKDVEANENKLDDQTKLLPDVNSAAVGEVLPTQTKEMALGTETTEEVKGEKKRGRRQQRTARKLLAQAMNGEKPPLHDQKLVPSAETNKETEVLNADKPDKSVVDKLTVEPSPREAVDAGKIQNPRETPWIRLRSSFHLNGASGNTREKTQKQSSRSGKVTKVRKNGDKPIDVSSQKEEQPDNKHKHIEETKAEASESSPNETGPREVTGESSQANGTSDETIDHSTLGTATMSMMSPEATSQKKGSSDSKTAQNGSTTVDSKTKIVGLAKKKKRVVSFSLFKHHQKDDGDRAKKQPGGKRKKGIMKKSTRRNKKQSMDTAGSPQDMGSPFTNTSYYSSPREETGSAATKKVSYVGYDIETNEGVEVVAIAKSLALTSPDAISLASAKGDSPGEAPSSPFATQSDNQVPDETHATTPTRAEQRVEIVLGTEKSISSKGSLKAKEVDHTEKTTSNSAFDWNFLRGFSTVPSHSVVELNTENRTEPEQEQTSLLSIFGGLSLAGASPSKNKKMKKSPSKPVEEKTLDQRPLGASKKQEQKSVEQAADESPESEKESKAVMPFFGLLSDNARKETETEKDNATTTDRDQNKEDEKSTPTSPGSLPRANPSSPVSSLNSLKNDKSVLTAYLAEKSEADSRSAPERKQHHKKVQDFLDNELKGQEEHSFPSGMDPDKNPSKALFYQKLAKQGKKLLSPEKKKKKSKKMPKVPSRLVCEQVKDEPSCLTYMQSARTTSSESKLGQSFHEDALTDPAAWDEIADASLVVERAIKKIEPTETGSVKSLDTKSVGEEVEHALLVLKKHADRLGVKESDLLLAVKSQDAETVASSKHRQDAETEASSKHKRLTSAESMKSLTIGEEILEVFKMYMDTKE